MNIYRAVAIFGELGGGHPSNNFKIMTEQKLSIFCSKLFDFDENKLNYQFFLLSIKISDEIISHLCCRRVFSDVLGQAPRPPLFSYSICMFLWLWLSQYFASFQVLVSSICLGFHKAFTPLPKIMSNFLPLLQSALFF